MGAVRIKVDAGILQAQQVAAAVERLLLPDNLGAFIEQQALQLGHKAACVFFEHNQTLSYQGLNARSNRLANSLLQMGVGKGTHVALMVPNHPAFPLAWIALAKIGAVIVPVNNNYTASELSYVLSDSDAQFLIIAESCLPAFDAVQQRPAALNDSNLVLLPEAGEDQRPWSCFEMLCEQGSEDFTAPVAVTRSDLMQIQYTSGTTGFPKGCMQTHQYWLQAAFTCANLIDGKIDNVLSMFPLFYLEPQLQLLTTFAWGGTVYIAKKASASRFMGWVRQFDIHYCTFHEVVMKGIPVSPEDADNPLRFVSAFQYKGDAHKLLEQRFKLIGRDAFAMTETGNGTYMPTRATHMVGSGSCGLPAPLRELKIVDDDWNDVAQGDSGVLWIRGPGMFLGYYNKPEANAAEFRGDWFCTGDIARQDGNGYYYIVGRTKEMIKRSGENIAAREVEAVLREIPEVLEAAVLPVPDEARKEEVKACVILRQGLASQDCPPPRIIAHCAERLAAFKVPRYIAYVEDFPRTPSNKVAKQKMIEQTDDLRRGAYDRVDERWR